MNEIADANNKMLQEQNVIKKTLHKNKNNDAINTVIANKQQLEDDAQALSTKEAELKVAQLNLAAEKSSAENEKNALLQQKAEAEKRQRQRQQPKQLTVQNKGTTSSCESFCKYFLQAQVQAAAQTPAATPAAAQTSVAAQPAVQTQAAAAPVATTSRPTYSTSASSYPVGECTWGARHWLHGLAITGATAVNGLQVQRLLDSVQDLNHKLVLLHVGMMVAMDT